MVTIQLDDNVARWLCGYLEVDQWRTGYKKVVYFAVREALEKNDKESEAK